MLSLELIIILKKKRRETDAYVVPDITNYILKAEAHSIFDFLTSNNDLPQRT